MEHTAYEAEPTDISLDDFDVLIDVRPDAATSPSIDGSTAVDFTELLAEPTRWIPTPTTRTLIICNIGLRSGIAVNHLRDEGYHAALSLAGGIDAWRAALRGSGMHYHHVLTDMPFGDVLRRATVSRTRLG